MLMERMEVRLTWSDLMTIRLIRRWVTAQAVEESPLRHVLELTTKMGQPPQLAAALHSLLQLTESCLGRALHIGCCCSKVITPDERAVLLMIAVAPSTGLPLADAAIPHGLPGALKWAAATVRRVFGETSLIYHEVAPRACPFDAT